MSPRARVPLHLRPVRAWPATWGFWASLTAFLVSGALHACSIMLAVHLPAPQLVASSARAELEARVADLRAKMEAHRCRPA